MLKFNLMTISFSHLSLYFSSPLIIFRFDDFSWILIGPLDAKFQQDRVKMLQGKTIQFYVFVGETSDLKFCLINIGEKWRLNGAMAWEEKRRKLEMVSFSCWEKADRIFDVILCLPVKSSQHKESTYIYFYLNSQARVSIIFSCSLHYCITIIIIKH